MFYDKSGELTYAQETALAGKLDQVLFRYFVHPDTNYQHSIDGKTIVTYNGFHEYYNIPEYVYTVHGERVPHFPQFYPTTDTSKQFRKEVKELLDKEGYELVKIVKGKDGDYFQSIKFRRKSV